MSTKIVHCEKQDYDIYIGRGSKWGNPFVIGKDGNRSDVINKYRTYILNNVELMNSIYELKDKTLGCWCSPKPCHGDVLIEIAERKGILTI